MANTECAQMIAKQRSKNLRFKKTIVKQLNLYDMQRRLEEMDEECCEVQWCGDTRGGVRQAFAELVGDEDEAAEMQMCFVMLSQDIERMREDLDGMFSCDEYDTEDADNDLRAYDDFLAAIRAGDSYGGYMGYDSFEGDYFGLDRFEGDLGVEEAAKRLKRLTKDELIHEAQKAFAISLTFIGIENRFENLKAALDMTKGVYGGQLEIMGQLDKLYDAEMEKEADMRNWFAFDRLTEQLPEQVWLE